MKNFNLSFSRDSANTSSPGKGSFMDDSSSIVSDMSYMNDGSWMRRLSSTFGSGDPAIDEAISGIYGDPVKILMQTMCSYALV